MSLEVIASLCLAVLFTGQLHSMLKIEGQNRLTNILVLMIASNVAHIFAIILAATIYYEYYLHNFAEMAIEVQVGFQSFFLGI